VRLYLLRHGEAQVGGVDERRRLTESGRHQVQALAALVAPRLAVQQVCHSGLERARETAEIVRQRLGPGVELRVEHGLEPDAPTSPWVERAGRSAGDLLLVGHLPHLERLASHLVGGDPDQVALDLPPGGLICLGRDDASGFSLQWMLTPELLGSGPDR
jgi:phosphohistidine phosphatase